MPIKSYLMNYYQINDNAFCYAHYVPRKKDPVTSHINTIMDYYTFLLVSGYLRTIICTRAINLLVQKYDRMKSLMDYVLSRRNKTDYWRNLPVIGFLLIGPSSQQEGEVSLSSYFCLKP